MLGLCQAPVKHSNQSANFIDKLENKKNDRGMRKAFALLWLIFSFSWGTTGAIQSQTLNLEKMVEQASRIVEGKLLSVAEASVPVPRAGSIPVIEYTLSVSTAIKGEPGPTVVLRQLNFPGASTYKIKVGERLILFLTAESQWGLSSPVGLEQGIFHIQEGQDGKPARVVNALNNPGPTSYKKFISAVKDLVVRQPKGGEKHP